MKVLPYLNVYVNFGVLLIFIIELYTFYYIINKILKLVWIKILLEIQFWKYLPKIFVVQRESPKVRIICFWNLKKFCSLLHLPSSSIEFLARFEQFFICEVEIEDERNNGACLFNSW